MNKKYLTIQTGSVDNEIRLVTTDEPTSIVVKVGPVGVLISIDDLREAIDDAERFIKSKDPGKIIIPEGMKLDPTIVPGSIVASYPEFDSQ